MPAAVAKVVHQGLDVPAVPRLERQLRREDEPLLVLEGAVAVGEVQIVPRHGLLLALSRKAAHRADHRLHLPIVGAGVHGDGAAHRAGNTVGELQAGEALVHGKAGEPGKENAAAGSDDVILTLQSVQPIHRLKDETLIALVGHQQVAAVAHVEGADIVLQGGAHRLSGLFLGLGQGHEPHRTADTEGGMAAHGLLRPQFQIRTGPGQLPEQRRISVHTLFLLFEGRRTRAGPPFSNHDYNRTRREIE